MSVCIRISSSAYGLGGHERLQGNEKPIQCKTCGKKFQRHEHLESHINARYAKSTPMKVAKKCMPPKLVQDVTKIIVIKAIYFAVLVVGISSPNRASVHILQQNTPTQDFYVNVEIHSSTSKVTMDTSVKPIRYRFVFGENSTTGATLKSKY